MNRIPTAIFVLAFIGLGARGLTELRLLPLLKPDAPALREALQADASNDDYLRQLLSDEGVAGATLPRPSAAIRESISSLPSPNPILFIAPRNTPANQLAFLVMKGLSFPHLLRYTWCEPQDAQPRADTLAALLLYNVPPPAESSNTSTVIPRLTLIPASQAQRWTAYCLR